MDALRRLPLLAAVALLGACSDSKPPPTGPTPAALEQALVSGGVNRFIVVLQSGNPREIATSHGVSPRFVYSHALHGFAGELNEAQVVALSRNPNVQSITPDGVVTVNVVWGLDRIDQRALPLDNSYTTTHTGAGVHAYIIDSGIRSTHTDFTGRVGNGADFSGNGNTNDCLGHGTHVSGTVGGTTYGVAKQVTLHPVRVFGCTGSTPTSTVIAGMDWVAANAVLPAVVNMSLGGPHNAIYDGAVSALNGLGITVVVAAGNENTDACTRSPASAPQAITVGATAANDFRASFSNFGGCVDLFAPGQGIISAWPTSDNAIESLSGTSMASPHVAGIAALILSDNPSLSPAGVDSTIKARSTKSVVNNAQSSNEHLAYSGREDMPITGNQAPSAAFTYSCVKTACQFTDQSTDDTGIASRHWNFDDGGTSSEANPTHIFHYGGSIEPWTVTLTVVDGGGRSSQTQRSFVVESVVQLAVRGYKRSGVNYVDLTWSEARSPMVRTIRYAPGFVVVDVPNTGSYTDDLGKGALKDDGWYRVCELPQTGDYQCSSLAEIPRGR